MPTTPTTKPPDSPDGNDTNIAICRAATKHGFGRQCRNEVWRDGYCKDHHPGADAVEFGFSRDEVWRIRLVDAVKAQLSVGDQGLTMAQIRSMMPVWTSKVACQVVEQALRKDPEITEARERRVNAAGRMQDQVVLRLRGAHAETR